MAIQANELRIGNWIARGGNGEHYQATPETISDLAGNRIAPISIPLTEEWLLKFGFERKSGIIHLYILKYAEDKIIEVCIDGSVRLWNGKYNWPQHYEQLWCNFKYVHQLQNLYFALTEEELTMKT